MRWLAYRTAAIETRRSPCDQLNANDCGGSCSRLDDNRAGCIFAKYSSITVHYPQSREVRHLPRVESGCILSDTIFAGCASPSSSPKWRTLDEGHRDQRTRHVDQTILCDTPALIRRNAVRHPRGEWVRADSSYRACGTDTLLKVLKWYRTRSCRTYGEE